MTVDRNCHEAGVQLDVFSERCSRWPGFSQDAQVLIPWGSMGPDVNDPAHTIHHSQEPGQLRVFQRADIYEEAPSMGERQREVSSGYSQGPELPDSSGLAAVKSPTDRVHRSRDVCISTCGLSHTNRSIGFRKTPPSPTGPSSGSVPNFETISATQIGYKGSVPVTFLPPGFSLPLGIGRPEIQASSSPTEVPATHAPCPKNPNATCGAIPNRTDKWASRIIQIFAIFSLNHQASFESESTNPVRRRGRIHRPM